MALKLEIISEHREIVGDDAVREFRGEGGTIGRSLNNDWILPDPDKFISGKHATIDCKGGIYYIADISTNGVYVNEEREPIGKSNPRRLFNGDHLFFGDFEIVVTIDEGEDLEMPAPPKPSVVPDHIEQLVEEVALKTGVQLLDEDEITGDEEFQSVLFGGDDIQQSEPPGVSTEEPEPEPELPSGPIAEPQHVSITADDLFDALLDGLQVSRAELHPSVDIAEAVRNAGEVLREFVVGTDKLLQSRADLKTAFRMDQTSILPRRNNPIKLSQNSADLIKQLLVGREGEYLGPRDSVREVCQDLLAHQDAFLDAMTTAFTEFAERFDPDELTESFERSIGRKPLLRFLNERKYWSLYRDLYPTLTEKGSGGFPQMFAEEFVKAYERTIAGSLRAERDSSLPGVKLEPIDEKKYREELSTAENLGETVKLTNQPEQSAPGAVLDDMDDMSTLTELVDFSDLEAASQGLDDANDSHSGNSDEKANG